MHLEIRRTKACRGVIATTHKCTTKKRVSTAPEIPYTESGPQSPMAFAGARTTYHSGDGHVQVPYGH